MLHNILLCSKDRTSTGTIGKTDAPAPHSIAHSKSDTDLLRSTTTSVDLEDNSSHDSNPTNPLQSAPTTQKEEVQVNGEVSGSEDFTVGCRWNSFEYKFIHIVD